MFVFPGVGLGVIACGAKRVTDRMFYKTALTLAASVSEEDLALRKVFPPIGDIRRVSHRIAVEVAKVAVEQGLATAQKDDDDTWAQHISDLMWEPDYRPLVSLLSSVWDCLLSAALNSVACDDAQVR